MKQTFKIMMLALALTFTLSFTAHAEHKEGCSKDAKKECCKTAGPDTSSPEFKKIKSLAGRWTTTTSMFGKKNERLYTEYKVTAAGSAVLETIFPGTPYEMISVYYDDKGKLTMTHYCMMKNRPTLKADKLKDDTLTLRRTKLEGPIDPKTPSMGDVTIEFKGKNKYLTHCKANKKNNHPAMTMEWTRVR